MATEHEELATIEELEYQRCMAQYDEQKRQDNERAKQAKEKQAKARGMMRAVVDYAAKEAKRTTEDTKQEAN